MYGIFLFIYLWHFYLIDFLSFGYKSEDKGNFLSEIHNYRLEIKHCSSLRLSDKCK